MCCIWNFSNKLNLNQETSSYYTINALALALDSVIKYAQKWRHSLERHLLATLEMSFTTVICL